MTLLLPDRYVWDFWFAPRDHSAAEPWHAFFLQAPRDLPDPNMRHGMATVGHAVSPDLVHWQLLPDALTPGAPGTWDDQAIWTGSIVERAGLYYFFYTGLSRGESGHVQRIGIATSPDLVHWTRHPGNPLLEADPRWYEKLGSDCWHEEACRDPFVFYAPHDDLYYMFYCARANSGPCGRRGVVGCARSRNLLDWEPLPPVAEPALFRHLEVPQVVALAGRYYLLFCTAPVVEAQPERAAGVPSWTGTHYLVADRPAGPYTLAAGEPLLADAAGTYYAGKLIECTPGEYVFMAWRQWDERGRFLGGLSNPAPVKVLDDGRLQIDAGRLWPRRIAGVNDCRIE